MTAPALTTTGTLHAAEKCAALLHTTLPSRLHQKRVETMDIPTYLTHVAAAYYKMDVHAPSPLDILASAAAVINDCASGPSSPSSFDATAIVLVAPPALESTLQLSSPHAKFDASAIAADAENEPISILESHIGPSDHILCTTNTNPDEETYFVSGRPVRAAAEKAAKALSAGKENGISVWKKPTPRKTTRPRRRGAQSAVVEATHKTKRPASRPYVCKYCNSTWKKHWDYRRHQDSHLSEKPITCSLCGYSAIQNSNFERHFRGHIPNGAALSTVELKSIAPQYRIVTYKHY